MCAMRTKIRAVDKRRDRNRVAGLENGLRAIEAFSAAAQTLSLSDVSRRAGLTRAAARRYLLTLTGAGYARFDGRRFELTPRVLRLGYAYVSSVPLPRIAQPIVDEIGNQTNEAASLAVLDGLEALVVAASVSRRIVGIFTRVGTHLPAVSSASGRVLLASASDDVLAHRLQRVSPIQRLTPKTKTSLGEIETEIKTIRERGYALNDEEIEIGLRVIAVPVRNSVGDFVAALSISTYSGRFEVKQLKPKFFSIMVEASKRLEKLI